MQILAAAVVVAATALDAVVVSTIDVIAAVVASPGSVDTVAAKVEESDSIVVTPISPVVSELLEGRQGPAETAPRKMDNANAENRILADQLTRLGKQLVSVDQRQRQVIHQLRHQSKSTSHAGSAFCGKCHRGAPHGEKKLGFGDKVFAVVFLGLLILATGSHCLTGTIALVKITGSSVCTLAFGVISAVILVVLAIPPSFTEIAILGYIDFISIILAIGITMIATGIQRSGAPGGFSSSTWSAWPQDDLSFTQALTAVSNIVFSYAFAAAQVSFMSEMHTPADFTKSIITLGLTEIVLYTNTGSVIYAFVGQEVQSPALLSASPLVSKVAFGIALPVIYISGSINATVACRFIHGRLYKNTITRFINTRKGWITWLAVVAFVIFISGFSFWIPPIMWFFLLKEGNWSDKHNVKRAACNCMAFGVGFFVFIAGTYASIDQIIAKFRGGSVGRPFSCNVA
ncbi:N amino acid transport system [Fusarium agapanthi]|uniref:N amino acid transport system n=1 Tax=Fusarium agapanthi TaxID=1803897 RepID=A0A9P5EGB3_9HYPO|nr:N amino acid transport system [Fusarium agapanthi]